MSCHLKGESYSFGLPYVLFVVLLIVILFISYFGSERGTLVLIAAVPGHCLSVTFHTIKALSKPLRTA